MTGKTSTAITSMKDNKISPLIAKKKKEEKKRPSFQERSSIENFCSKQTSLDRFGEQERSFLPPIIIDTLPINIVRSSTVTSDP
jgi:hypothetical protein